MLALLLLLLLRCSKRAVDGLCEPAIPFAASAVRRCCAKYLQRLLLLEQQLLREREGGAESCCCCCSKRQRQSPRSSSPVPSCSLSQLRRRQREAF